MKKMLLILGGLAVLAIIGVAIFEYAVKPSVPPAMTASAPAPAPAASPVSTAMAALATRPSDVVMGSPEAQVTIIEYASLTCPHCAAFHNGTLPAIKEQFVDKGTVKLLFRDFPFDGLALRAAMLPHCVGPERYYGLLGTLFARQEQWRSNPDPLNALAAIARQAGMDDEAFKACLANKAIEDKVLQSRLEGEKTLGVNSTPTLFINGQKYNGVLTIEQMRGVLEPLIAGR